MIGSMCCDTSDGTLLLQLFRLLFPIQAVLKLPSVNKELVIPSEVIAWLQEKSWQLICQSRRCTGRPKSATKLNSTG